MDIGNVITYLFQVSTWRSILNCLWPFFQFERYCPLHFEQPVNILCPMTLHKNYIIIYIVQNMTSVVVFTRIGLNSLIFLYMTIQVISICQKAIDKMYCRNVENMYEDFNYCKCVHSSNEATCIIKHVAWLEISRLEPSSRKNG